VLTAFVRILDMAEKLKRLLEALSEIRASESLAEGGRRAVSVDGPPWRAIVGNPIARL